MTPESAKVENIEEKAAWGEIMPTPSAATAAYVAFLAEPVYIAS